MKEEKDFSSVTHYTHVDVQPGGINIQNVEHLYQADILKQLGIELEMRTNTEKETSTMGEAAVDADDGLVKSLMPIFYNNEADVRQFLKEIRGMAQEDMTDLVNRWVKEKRISGYGNSRKGVLWGILNKAGLYTRSKQNWNGRVV